MSTASETPDTGPDGTAPNPARIAFLARLDAARAAAAIAETQYRAEAARRAEELGRARAYAYRRADLMASLAAAIEAAPDAEMAVASAQAMLRARLGWSTDSDARTEVLARFAPVALAVFEAADDAAPEPALAAFEDWYLGSRQSAFWYLFEHYLPDTPLVDF